MESRELERRLALGRLLDFYGPLLTRRRREIARMYCEEDLSLQEIASCMTEDGSPLTRQGVYDAVVKSEKQLLEYEEKLGLMKRYDFLAAEAKRGLVALEKQDYESAREALENMTDF